jgi:hypothetical protein
MRYPFGLRMEDNKPVLECVKGTRRVRFDAQGDATEESLAWYKEHGFVHFHTGYVFYANGVRNKWKTRHYFYHKRSNLA